MNELETKTELDKKTRRREQVKMAQRRHMAKKKAMLEKVPETNDDETESESDDESVADMKPQKAVVVKPMKKTASQIEEDHGTDASPNMDDEPKKDKALHKLMKHIHRDLKMLKMDFMEFVNKLQDPVSDDTDEEPEQFPEPPKTEPPKMMEQPAPKSMAVFV